MSDKKRFRFGLGLIAAIIGALLSVFGFIFFKLWPNVTACCKGMMDRCCPPKARGKTAEPKTGKRKVKGAKKSV